MLNLLYYRGKLKYFSSHVVHAHNKTHLQYILVHRRSMLLLQKQFWKQFFFLSSFLAQWTRAEISSKKNPTHTLLETYLQQESYVKCNPEPQDARHLFVLWKLYLLKYYNKSAYCCYLQMFQGWWKSTGNLSRNTKFKKWYNYLFTEEVKWKQQPGFCSLDKYSYRLLSFWHLPVLPAVCTEGFKQLWNVLKAILDEIVL